MANVLKMAMIEAIQQLHAAGWSQRRIAAELQVDRSTVARYLRPPPPEPKPAIPPPGSEASKPAILFPFPARAEESAVPTEAADSAADSKPAISPSGSEAEIQLSGCEKPTVRNGRISTCESRGLSGAETAR